MRWFLFTPHVIALLAQGTEQDCGCGFATAGSMVNLTGAAMCQAHTGVRRHRWLCHERC
jgi:hypothetical protein